MKTGTVVFLDNDAQVGIIRGPRQKDTVFFSHIALRNLTFPDLSVGLQVAYIDAEHDGLLHATVVATSTEGAVVETAIVNATARGWKSGTVLITMLKVGIIRGAGDVNVRFGEDVVNPSAAFAQMVSGTAVWYTDKQGPDGVTRIATAVELQ